MSKNPDVTKHSHFWKKYRKTHPSHILSDRCVTVSDTDFLKIPRGDTESPSEGQTMKRTRGQVGCEAEVGAEDEEIRLLRQKTKAAKQTELECS